MTHKVLTRLPALAAALVLSVLPADRLPAEEGPAPQMGRIEVVLAKEHQKQIENIRQDFAAAGLVNVHFQFVRMGHPPMNLGVGPGVPAEQARAAIRLAKKYNDGIIVLLPDYLFPERFVTIASSNYDDTVEYKIDAGALRQLEDPALTSEQWHALYRRLTPADRPPVKKGRLS